MFETINPNTLTENVFSLIGDRWMLVTAGTKEQCNTMTASWGGLGILWNRPMATCYIRPQRYTRTFIEREDYFTLSFFGGEYHKALAFCGAKSGRDVDKIKECGFTIAAGEGNAPYFEEAELVLVCRKAYCQQMDPACILMPGADEKNYPGKDYHYIYMGEIVECFKKREG